MRATILPKDHAEIVKETAVCVRYGFCTNTCPTYTLTGDEKESPRGRIQLIKTMLETGAAPDADTVRHIDSCLSCLACETSCAASVGYRRIIDAGRAYIEATYKRPFLDRLLRRLLVGTLPHPARLRRALFLARLSKPFARILPQVLRTMLTLLPSGPISGPTARQLHRKNQTLKGRVILHSGCIQQVMADQINQATIRLLTRLGYEVVENQAAECCGALAHHMGYEDQGKTSAARSLRIWQNESAKDSIAAIIVTASGCGTTMKHLEDLLPDRSEAQMMAKKVYDITEFLCRETTLSKVLPGHMRVAYHDACSMRNGQKITHEPRLLLAQAGFEVVSIPEAHFCCGSAGVYNILQFGTAEELGRRKAKNAKRVRPDVIAAGNLGCMVQIGQYSDVPLVHTVELLDWATGGPKPEALAGVELRAKSDTTSPPDPGQSVAEDDFLKKDGYQW